MRSLTSVYQLMPIYKVLQIGNESHRIAEVANLPNISQEKAQNALAFHREIETAVNSNPQDTYATVPFVGVQQPTLQSAELKDSKIVVSKTLPIIMSGLNHLADRDGTVPQISAFPIEFSDRDVLEIPSFIALQYKQTIQVKMHLMRFTIYLKLQIEISGKMVSKAQYGLPNNYEDW